MRNMSKVFTEAHRITRDMVEEYGMNYRAQFAITLSYLLNKEGEEVEGTEKQVKWANEILETVNRVLDNVAEGAKAIWSDSERNQRAASQRVNAAKKVIADMTHAGQVIESFKDVSYAKDAQSRVLTALTKVQGATHDAGVTDRRGIGITFPQSLVIYAIEKEEDIA